jgi:hypothetical protein
VLSGIVRAPRAYGNSHLAAALLLQCTRPYAALCRIVRAPRTSGNSHLAAALLLQCARLYAALCRIVRAPRAYGNSHLAAALLLQCALYYAALCSVVRVPHARACSHLAASYCTPASDELRCTVASRKSSYCCVLQLHVRHVLKWCTCTRMAYTYTSDVPLVTYTYSVPSSGVYA